MSEMPINRHNRIEVRPEVHFGKPCVAGTRIPVHSVLELVREGMPFEQIRRDYYPDLSVEDIKACVQYATSLKRGVNEKRSLQR
jgi:uncharacterized protein (DUF433 family)